MEQLIKIDHVSKYYGSFLALNDVDLELPKGKIIGLLGPNGSGKTTLIKILNGLLKDYKGTVEIDQHTVGAYTKSIVSYLPDQPYFQDWMSAKDALNLFVDMYDDFDYAQALSIMERFSIKETQRIKAMSKGTVEKFQLALVMSRKARLYILDEPIGGVDPAAREVILDIILNNYNKDSSLIIATHLIADIERIFDHVVFIKEGKIVLNKDVDEVRAEKNMSIDELFREEFRCY